MLCWPLRATKKLTNSSSSYLLHRPKLGKLLPRQPLARRTSSATLAAPGTLLAGAFAVALAQLLQHREALLDFLHSVFESRRVRQPAYILGREAQAVFEVGSCQAEGLEGGALGGEGGFLDGARGRGCRRVVDLLAEVLFLVLSCQWICSLRGWDG